MARSSAQDPVERFRFKVLVIEDILASQGANLIQAIKGVQVKQIGAGFSEVTIPKAEVNEITYRENTHANRFIKKPGLTRYEPVVFKKGVTSTTELYDWYKLVSNDAIGYSVASLVVGALQVPPAYPAQFRKDILITSLDRSGQALKSWVLLDAFPTGYKGGNDFDSQSNEKLIAELTVSFEAMVEISGENLQQLTDEADSAAIHASIAAALGFTVSGGKIGGGIF